jgi:predicted membrane chloride channel (bestrophin family)
MNKVSRIGKSEILSWRLSREVKTQLETAARDEKASVDAILDRAVREWLVKRPRQLSEEEQRRLREQLLQAAGTVSVGGPSATNAEVRRVMGEYLEAKYRASQRRAPRRPR